MYTKIQRRGGYRALGLPKICISDKCTRYARASVGRAIIYARTEKMQVRKKLLHTLKSVINGEGVLYVSSRTLQAYPVYFEPPSRL